MVGVKSLVLNSEVLNDQNAHAIFELATATDPQPDGAGYDVNVQTSGCGFAVAAQ